MTTQTLSKPEKKNTSNIYIENLTPLNNLLLTEQNKLLERYPNLVLQQDPIPVAFQIKTDQDIQFHLSLSEWSPNQKNYTIQGLSSNGVVLFEGALTTSKTVPIKRNASPHVFAYLEDDLIQWQLYNQTDNTTIAIGDTAIELYWVALNNDMPNLYRKGIPVEGLRVMAKANLEARFPKIDGSGNIVVGVVSAATIINSAFNYVAPRYDIWHGAPHFVTINSWNNITLHWQAFIHAHNNLPNSILNCYDEAAIAQYWLYGYNYNAIAYCYMNPFGYLAQTNLIGRGQCNNPFYGSSNTQPVVNQQDANRTAFGNHAFIRFNLTYGIADSCAGPHTGNEFIQQYIASATDAVYPNPPRVPRGSAANVSYYTGITNVNAIKSVKSLSMFPHIKTLKKRIAYNAKKLSDSFNNKVSGTWQDPLKFSAFGASWTSSYQELVPGEDEVLKIQMLQNGKASVMIKLYVSNNNNAISVNRFLSMASLSEREQLPFEALDGTSAQHALMANSPGNGHYIGLFHNVVLSIHTTDNAIDIGALADWYFTWAKSQLKPVQSHKEDFEGLKGHITNTGQLKVALPKQKHLLVEYIDSADKAQIEAIDTTYLTLNMRSKRPQKLQFAIIDTNTLLVTTHIMGLKNL
ncbi:hypothetical protein [Hanstruepera flava]|uniref:hypothetical protein n=1 Tax=Hanstruepera flava TaxID=2930218 RepID=UPI0020292995|nr:hypothetical protein [Hanstruepera flava]